MLKKILILTLSFFFVWGGGVNAQTCDVTVNPGESIQQGITSATSGQTVCVYGGIYNERIVISKPLTVVGVEQQGSIPELRGNYTIPAATDCLSGCQGLPFAWEGMVQISSTQDVTVENFNIYESQGQGTVVDDSRNVFVRNVNVYGARYSGFHSEDSTNVTYVESTLDNLINHATFSRSSNDLNWPSGVFATRGGVIKFEQLVVSNIWGEGMNFWGSVDGGSMKNNVIKNAWRTQIYLDKTQNVVVEGNILTHDPNSEIPMGPGVAMTAEDSGNNQNLTIQNNTIVGTSTAFYIDDWGGATGNQNVTIRNNTVYNPTKVVTTYGDKHTGSFYNNIVYSEQPIDFGNLASGFNSSNNMYYNVSGGAGQEFNTNPLLSNPSMSFPLTRESGNLFSLQSNSPAINKANTNAPEKDFFGCARNGVADLGAIEFRGTNCNQPNPTPTTAASPTPQPTPSISPTFDPKFDLDENGVVNILDVVEVIKYIFR